MSKAIRVLVLSDGKPGHLSGSMGVVKSMQRHVPVEHKVLRARLRVKLMRYPLRVLLNVSGLGKRTPLALQRLFINIAYKFEQPELLASPPVYDWVVSAGGDTSFLNAWIAQAYGIQNLYCSSLRRLKPTLFTVRLSLKHTYTAGFNEIGLDLSPSLIERGKIAEAGRQYREQLNLGKERVWAVLIGGTGAGYYYDRAAMESISRGILALAAGEGAQLLITTSRRTGIDHERTLISFFDAHPAVIHACYFNHAPEKVVARFLGAADTVFCTADSGSMIVESMAAGKPTYIVESDEVKPEAPYQAFLQQHLEARRIRRVSIKALPGVAVEEEVASCFHLLESDPITELAEKITPWIRPETSCESPIS